VLGELQLSVSRCRPSQRMSVDLVMNRQQHDQKHTHPRTGLARCRLTQCRRFNDARIRWHTATAYQV